MDSTILKVIILIVAFATKYSKCTADGISYLEPVNSKPLPNNPGSDPCNPLYWYPKNIPAYCYVNATSKPIAGPIPIPIPVPIPQPLPPPVPLPYGLPLAPSHPMVPVAGGFQAPPPNLPYPQAPPPYPPYPQPAYSPYPQVPPPYPQVPPPYPQVPPPYPQVPPPYPQVPPPYSNYPQVPPHPLMSVSSFGSYPSRRQQVGMVPGIPGIVSKDGGINILPFSDVYSDIIEKHKNKMLRKRLEKAIKDYDDYPRMIYGRRRNYRRRMFD